MPRCSSEGIGVLCLLVFLLSDSSRPEYAHICAFQLVPRKGKRYCARQAHAYSAAKTYHMKRITITCEQNFLPNHQALDSSAPRGQGSSVPVTQPSSAGARTGQKRLENMNTKKRS